MCKGENQPDDRISALAELLRYYDPKTTLEQVYRELKAVGHDMSAVEKLGNAVLVTSFSDVRGLATDMSEPYHDRKRSLSKAGDFWIDQHDGSIIQRGTILETSLGRRQNATRLKLYWQVFDVSDDGTIVHLISVQRKGDKYEPRNTAIEQIPYELMLEHYQVVKEW